MQKGETLQTRPGMAGLGTAKKRRYVSLRVPESVLQRVHRRLSARAAV
jgi:predicted DNA binding CopG/RHH family protein